MRLTPLLLLVSAVVLGWSLPAQAHTALVSSDPADGAHLDAAPGQIVLTFSEELKSPAEAVVSVDGGQQEWTTVLDGARLVITPTGEPAEGAYSVDYRVVSADGHPVTGALSFTAGESAADDADTTASATDDSTWSTPLLVGVAVVAVAILGAGLVLLRGRSRSTSAR